MPIQIHVGKFRLVPFVVRLDGAIDSQSAVDVGSTQPGNLQVELHDFRTLKVTALNVTSLASAVVKAFPGTASEGHFPLDFTVATPVPGVPGVEFGPPGEEQAA